MKHRSHYSILLSVAMALIAPALASADHHKNSTREIYDLRVYKLKSEEKARAFDEMVKTATIPALKRLGVGPVGVFKSKDGANKNAAEGSEHWRYVLAPYKSFATLASVRDKLAKDDNFLAGAGDFLSADKKDPAYTRIESSLLLAFEGMPTLVVPAAAKKEGERFFELRVYESHSEAKAHLKVEMFNKGEFDIFAKTGLKPVFFGQALAGANLPQLTYMLAYDNEAAQKAAWKAFGGSPEWKELKTVEKYKDTVSKIIQTFLVATEASQIK